jgi:hypothetical protein
MGTLYEELHAFLHLWGSPRQPHDHMGKHARIMLCIHFLTYYIVYYLKKTLYFMIIMSPLRSVHQWLETSDLVCTVNF